MSWITENLGNKMPGKRKKTLLVFMFVCLWHVCFLKAKEVDFFFKSSFDVSKQLATAYIPDNLKNPQRPLLVIAHYWGGNRYTAKSTNYYAECEKRSWLLVCPELHGHKTDGKTSLASLEAQHDIMDSIQYMENNYKVDSSRIYLAGRSMGGMLAQMMAAKYPDIFAGIVAGQGISDLKSWIEQSPRFRAGVEKECGIYSAATRFEYERRSSLYFAENIQYVPLLLWHGTNDTWVPEILTERLYDCLKKYNKYQIPVFWLQNAAHCSENYPASWVCEQLAVYQNKCESGMKINTRFYSELSITTDEAKKYFWLGITPDKKNKFAKVRASILQNTLLIKAKNTAKVSIDLNKVAQNVRFSSFEVKSDIPVILTITRADKILFKVIVNNNKKGKLSGLIHFP